MTSRPRLAGVVLIVSALLLGFSLLVIAMAGSSSSVESVGSRPPVPAPTLEQATSSEGPTREKVSKAKKDAASEKEADPKFVFKRERRDATVLPVRDRGAIPVDLRIPVLGVETRVVEVGVSSEGLVEVPEDVLRVGWYKHSQVASADSGAMVLVGHRDGVDQGAGAFFRLGELDEGDEVVVRTADGERVRYVVVAREAFDKKVVPLRELFSRAGEHRLTLITCGGPFEEATLGYTDNIVVTAVRADQA